MKRTWKALAAMMLIVTAIIVAGCNKPDEHSGGNSNGQNDTIVDPNNGGGNNDSDVRVTTYTPQDITATTAVCGGDVIAVQGLSLSGIGVCWSTENNPTIDDSHVFSEQWNEPFVCIIEDLEPETQYYVRAVALRGLMCYYGEIKSFTTLENNNGGNDTIIECPPSIQVLQGEGYAVDDQIVDLDTEVNFGFVMASCAGTNEELSSLRVMIDDIEFAVVDLTGNTEYTYTDRVTYSIQAKDIIGRSVITATVTDFAGRTAYSTIALNINQPALPLDVNEITWIRRGPNFIGNTEEEMADYGLYWSGNYKDVYATIKPLEGSVLYVCNGNDYWGITTDVEKAAYYTSLIETTSPIESYRNVTIYNSANYNDLLVVIEGDGDVHLILISRAEIENEIYGTQVSIMGEAK